MDCRALAVNLPILRPPAEQALVIHRLELVGVAVKNLEVADAEMAGPSLEEIRRRQGS